MADNPAPGLTFEHNQFNVSDKVWYKPFGTSTPHPAIIVDIERYQSQPGKRQYKVIFATGLDIGISEMSSNVADAYIYSHNGQKELGQRIKSVPFVQSGEVTERGASKRFEIDALWPYIRRDYASCRPLGKARHNGFGAMVWRAANPTSKQTVSNPVYRADNEYPGEILMMEHSEVYISRPENLIDAIDLFHVSLTINMRSFKISAFNAPIQVSRRIDGLIEVFEYDGSDPMLLKKLIRIKKHLINFIFHHKRVLNNPKVLAQNAENNKRFFKLEI